MKSCGANIGTFRGKPTHRKLHHTQVYQSPLSTGRCAVKFLSTPQLEPDVGMFGGNVGANQPVWRCSKPGNRDGDTRCFCPCPCQLQCRVGKELVEARSLVHLFSTMHMTALCRSSLIWHHCVEVILVLLPVDQLESVTFPSNGQWSVASFSPLMM